MADELHIYPIKGSRLKKSLMFGFEQVGNNTISCVGRSAMHLFAVDMIDGINDNASWGRLKFTCAADEDMVLIVYALASNDPATGAPIYSNELSISDKRRYMEEKGAIKVLNEDDILLYSQTGRYLFVMMVYVGTGKGSIGAIKILNRGDILMDTLPEVYKDQGGFLHRFSSAFSSMFLDLQERINHSDELLCVDKAPKELLPILAGWMGVDVSGDFLKEDRLRLLVKEAYSLNRMKGTKRALERLSEIVLGEKAIVLEKCADQDTVQGTETESSEDLYGNSRYDVTLLIRTYVPEDKKSQLMFLLNQYKPVRCRLLIRFLEDSSQVDAHTYMDVNATLSDYSAPVLDERQETDGMIILNE